MQSKEKLIKTRQNKAKLSYYKNVNRKIEKATTAKKQSIFVQKLRVFRGVRIIRVTMVHESSPARVSAARKQL